MWETWVQSLGQERSPGEGNGSPVQYLAWKNPMDGGAWWATVHGVTKSWTRLSDSHTLFWGHLFPLLVSSISHAHCSFLLAWEMLAADQ